LLSASRAGIMFASAPRSTRRKASGGVISQRGSMPIEPSTKRATILVGQEKAIDVRLAHQRAYDSALVFSQEQER